MFYYCFLSPNSFGFGYGRKSILSFGRGFGYGSAHFRLRPKPEKVVSVGLYPHDHAQTNAVCPRQMYTQASADFVYQNIIIITTVQHSAKKLMREMK